MPRRLISTVLAMVAMAAAAVAAEEHDDHDGHVASLNGVRVVHAWTRAGAGPEALIFADIENNSDAVVVLKGGESDRATSVELVGFELKDGEPSYVVLPSMPIQPGGELVLAPNGLALRLDRLSAERVEGGELEVAFEFAFGHIDAHVEIGAAHASGHSHAGHNH